MAHLLSNKENLEAIIHIYILPWSSLAPQLHDGVKVILIDEHGVARGIGEGVYCKFRCYLSYYD
jgi:hypothetical protein